MSKKVLILFIIFFIFFCIPIFSQDQKQLDTNEKLNSIQNSLIQIEDEYATAFAKYLSPISLNKEYKEPIENKIKKANFYFDKKDFISSGSLFYSIVAAYEGEGQLWEEALFKLAESLFLNRNFISALRYYEMIIAMKESNYKVDSLKRLISASYYIGEYSVAKKYYNQFLEMNYDASNDQDLFYYLAKSLFYDNQTEEAEKIFLSINDNGDYFPQSLYFLGVIKIKKGQLDDALKYFETVTEITDNKNYEKFDNILEHSILAAARVAFEIGDLEKSIKYYLLIDKKSKYFPEAYYELCWTYIKKDDYTRAIDSLRLIKYIAPESIVAPKAELLEGSLLVKVRKYGEAMVIFDNIVKKYSVTKKELFSIDNKTFLINARSDKAESALSPYSPIVKSLLQDNKKFNNAMNLSNDISELESDLGQISKLEFKVGTMVDNKNAASLFPSLKDGSNLTIYLQNKLSNLRNELMQLRKNTNWDSLSEEEKNKFNEFEKEKKKLTDVLKDSPVVPDQIEKKATEYAKKIILMEEELHRISIQTNSLYKQLETISAYYAKEKGSSSYDVKVVERINREKTEIQNSIDLLSEYKVNIEKEKSRLILGGDMISRIIIARNNLNKIISKQDAILAKSGSNSDKVDNLINEVEKIDKKLDEFYAKLNEAVKEIINKVRVSYENEKNALNLYRSEILEIKREINEMAALSMYSNINRVKEAFSNLILQADLGIIDVAWEKKDECTSDILKLRTQRAREIQQLYLNLEGDE